MSPIDFVCDRATLTLSDRSLISKLELKGIDLILFLRPHDPCWYDDDYASLCVDHLFLDEEGYYCDDYEYGAEEEGCGAKDIFTGKLARELCCGCGGGDRYDDAGDEL